MYLVRPHAVTVLFVGRGKLKPAHFCNLNSSEQHDVFELADLLNSSSSSEFAAPPDLARFFAFPCFVFAPLTRPSRPCFGSCAWVPPWAVAAPFPLPCKLLVVVVKLRFSFCSAAAKPAVCFDECFAPSPSLCNICKGLSCYSEMLQCCA